jgi:hypothetical protein
MDEIRSRFSSAPWAGSRSYPLTIGGIGNIGSYLTLFLSRIGHSLFLIDKDTVETSNMGGQLYSRSQVGHNKTRAAVQISHEFSGNYTVYEYPLDVTAENSSIVIEPHFFSCFDNMAARKFVYKRWYGEYKDLSDKDMLPPIFIDGRTGAESYQVFFVTMERAEEFESKYLFDDSEVEAAPCSYKATSHIGCETAIQMVKGFVNHISNHMQGENIREIPFMVETCAALFKYTVI